MPDTTAHTDNSEKELLLKVAAGDQRAFGELVDRYTHIVYPYLLYWLKQPPLAEEVTQDVFLRLWNNRQKLPTLENFSGYVYVIARNRANTALKAQLLGTKELPDDRLHSLLHHPQNLLEVQDLQRIIDEGIAALPPRRQEVFELSRNEELSYEEIAKRLGISHSAVRQHIVEALVFLRHYLKEKSGITISLLLLLSW